MTAATPENPSTGGSGIPRSLMATAIAAVVLIVLSFAAQTLLKYEIVQVNPLFVGNVTTGVDVSNHQGEVDMRALADQGVQFVYVKATEGASFVDEYFDENWSAAKAAGIPRGAYHFFSFDTPGADQAASFIATVGPLEGDLIPVVDVEWYKDKKNNPPAKEDLVRELGEYLDALEAEYGVKPMIYSTGALYNDYIADAFGAYPRWVRSVSLPAWLYVDRYTLWQYSSRGKLDGSTGHEQYFDMNALNPAVTLEQLTVG